MLLSVETLSLPQGAEAKRLIAVPSDEHGFFIEEHMTVSHGMNALIFLTLGIEGASDEQIEACEKGELNNDDIFHLSYLGNDYPRISIHESLHNLAAVAILGSPRMERRQAIGQFKEAQFRGF